MTDKANNSPCPPSSPSRRSFLKRAGIATSVLAAGVPKVHAASDSVIRVGLIGCGGRGTGAAVNAMNADPAVRIVALADLFRVDAELSQVTSRSVIRTSSSSPTRPVSRDSTATSICWRRRSMSSCSRPHPTIGPTISKRPSSGQRGLLRETGRDRSDRRPEGRSGLAGRPTRKA